MMNLLLFYALACTTHANEHSARLKDLNAWSLLRINVSLIGIVDKGSLSARSMAIIAATWEIRTVMNHSRRKKCLGPSIFSARGSSFGIGIACL